MTDKRKTFADRWKAFVWKVIYTMTGLFVALSALFVWFGMSNMPKSTPKTAADYAQESIDAEAKKRENFEIKAQVFCANQIENVMRDPEFSIGVFDTPQVQPARNNGRLFIWRDLSSRNGFGMDVKVTAHCAVDGDGNLIVLMVNGRDMLQ